MSRRCDRMGMVGDRGGNRSAGSARLGRGCKEVSSARWPSAAIGGRDLPDLPLSQQRMDWLFWVPQRRCLPPSEATSLTAKRSSRAAAPRPPGASLQEATWGWSGTREGGELCFQLTARGGLQISQISPLKPQRSRTAPPEQNPPHRSSLPAMSFRRLGPPVQTNR